MKEASHVIQLRQRFVAFMRGLGRPPRKHVHWTLWCLAGVALAWFPHSFPKTVVIMVAGTILVWKCQVTCRGISLCGLTSLVVTVILFCLWVSEPGRENARQQIPFNTQQWNSGSRDDGIMWPTRLRMADDLVKGGLLTGRSRKEVLALLGSPDISEELDPHQPFVYILGPERGLIRIDPESLYIDFDDSDHVASISVHR